MARRRSRQAALMTVGAASVAVAAFWVWRLAGREQIAELTTAHLGALLALTVLPGAAWGAWRLDRRMGAARPRDGAR
jgi:hypothetical protein